MPSVQKGLKITMDPNWARQKSHASTIELENIGVVDQAVSIQNIHLKVEENIGEWYSLVTWLWCIHGKGNSLNPIVRGFYENGISSE